MTNLESLREALAVSIESHAKECHKCGGSGMLTNTGPDPQHDPCPTCEPYYWLASEARALDLTPFQPVGAGTSIAVSPAPSMKYLQGGHKFSPRSMALGAPCAICGRSGIEHSMSADPQREEAKATLRITEHLRDAANFVEACEAANQDLLHSKSELRKRLNSLLERELSTRQERDTTLRELDQSIKNNLETQRQLQEAQQSCRSLMGENERLLKAYDAIEDERDAALREADALRTDAGRYRHLRMQSSPFLVLQPRTTGHIGYYGDELDRRIDAAIAGGGKQ